jgi:hypothetical protein
MTTVLLATTFQRTSRRTATSAEITAVDHLLCDLDRPALSFRL